MTYCLGTRRDISHIPTVDNSRTLCMYHNLNHQLGLANGSGQPCTRRDEYIPTVDNNRTTSLCCILESLMQPERGFVFSCSPDQVRLGL